MKSVDAWKSEFKGLTIATEKKENLTNNEAKPDNT